ncbi:MAG: choice-of-anchor D domain-containing protein, partial [Ignavibacteriae bacterium]|nr:choice-of-anchor D domain-containing protein [Ignavibacteriota bacterium]
GEVRATVLASDIASVGTRSITVFNPSPDGGESNAQTLTIHSPAPVFVVHPPSIDFGNSLVGITQTDCVVVANTGTADLMISGVTSDNSAFNATPTSATIHRQDSLKFEISFDPSAVGSTSGHIIFVHNTDTSPDSVDVSGTGLDSTRFRTATADDWASAIDAKGKHKAYPRKPDKVFFKLRMVAPTPSPSTANLDLSFNIPIASLKAYTSDLKGDTLAYASLTADAKKKIWRYTFNPPLAGGTFFQIDGVGLQGKLVKVKYVWTDAGLSNPVKGSIPDGLSGFGGNQVGLPRPNLVNISDELFPKGFGQPTPYFSDLNPLILGIPQGAKGAKSVKLLKSGNVVKSFVDEKTNTKHTQGPSCLDTFNDPSKPISSQQSVLSPLKKNDNLFAELLALKLNLAASATTKFPPGLDALTFDDPNDPANPFNTKLVRDIAKYIDSLLSCLTLQDIPASRQQALDVLQKINGAFADGGNQKDTISFLPKTRLQGVKPIAQVAFLHKTPGIVPESFAAYDVNNTDIPLMYVLYQNYPNPFNPTTIIRFDLPEPSVVTLKVFNVLGQQVALPIEYQVMEDGVHEVEFDGQALPSGVYFYQVIASGNVNDDGEITPRDAGAGHQFTDIKKMLLIR